MIFSAIHSITDDIGGVERFEEGDIYLTNDPYANTFHVHDVNAIKPVFLAGELVGSHAFARIAMTVGGRPGPEVFRQLKFSRGAHSSVCQLYRAGKLNEDILRINS